MKAAEPPAKKQGAQMAGRHQVMLTTWKNKRQNGQQQHKEVTWIPAQPERGDLDITNSKEETHKVLTLLGGKEVSWIAAAVAGKDEVTRIPAMLAGEEV